LAFLKLINQLLPACQDSLPANTYEAKKYLTDMGLGYHKIPACRNECMLFWRSNGKLESCIICGESKLNDEIHLDRDCQPSLCGKTWHRDQIHFLAFRAHNDECLMKMNKKYKNKDAGIVKKTEATK
jgi:hypothetical protein